MLNLSPQAWILAFAAGVLCLQQQPVLPAPSILLALVLIVLLSSSMLAWSMSSLGMSTLMPVRAAVMSRLLLLLLGGLAAGFAWSGWMAQQRIAQRLDPALEGQPLRLTGVVRGLPQAFDGGLRFEFEATQAVLLDALNAADDSEIPNSPGLSLPARLSLSWYGAAPAMGALRAGERWQLDVRLKRPRGTRNPHGFDFEAWLLERGIAASGSVMARGLQRGLPPQAHAPADWQAGVDRLRQRLRDLMQQQLPASAESAVLQALVIGDQRAIDSTQWQLFARTGVSHLMSISGLHVTMFAAVAGLLALWLWRGLALCWPTLALRIAARRLSLLAGFVAALGYCLLAGFAVPAQRTLWMIAVSALALWSHRTPAPSQVLLLALLAVLLPDPWAVLAPGFWLSFGAVAVIFLAAQGAWRGAVASSAVPHPRWLPPALSKLCGRAWASLREWAAVQWAITLGLAPAMLLLFQQLSLVSPLANALAIPLVSFLITPLAIVGALLLGLGQLLPSVQPSLQWLGTHALEAAHALVAGMLPALRWLSQQDYAVWQPAAPPLWTLFPALLGVLWLLLPRGVPARWLGGLLLLPMLWLAGIGSSQLATPPDTPPEAPSTQPLARSTLRPGEMRLTMLDVGQGLAVVVRTASQVLLFDSGPGYGWNGAADSNAGARLVLPYLRGEGIRSLDVLVLSHWDADHAGGAAAISAALPVSRLYVSEPAPPGLATPQARYQGRCRAQQSWQIDGVRFRFLSPDPALADDPLEKRNDRSCVLRIDSAHGSALLLADIERRAEARLIAAAERNAAESTTPGATTADATTDDLKTDVLLVPHHGSATSSSAEFIAATRPQLALVSAGYRNRFRHPRAEVVERWRQAGAQVLRTDEEGALQVQFSPGGLHWQRQRSVQQRYWH